MNLFGINPLDVMDLQNLQIQSLSLMDRFIDDVKRLMIAKMDLFGIIHSVIWMEWHFDCHDRNNTVYSTVPNRFQFHWHIAILCILHIRISIIINILTWNWLNVIYKFILSFIYGLKYYTFWNIICFMNKIHLIRLINGIMV